MVLTGSRRTTVSELANCVGWAGDFKTRCRRPSASSQRSRDTSRSMIPERLGSATKLSHKQPFGRLQGIRPIRVDFSSAPKPFSLSLHLLSVIYSRPDRCFWRRWNLWILRELSNAYLRPDQGSKHISGRTGHTVLETVRLMVEHNIGAVPVLHNDKLVGIFSERDLMKRVVAEGRDPAAPAWLRS